MSDPFTPGARVRGLSGEYGTVAEERAHEALIVWDERGMSWPWSWEPKEQLHALTTPLERLEDILSPSTTAERFVVDADLLHAIRDALRRAHG